MKSLTKIILASVILVGAQSTPLAKNLPTDGQWREEIDLIISRIHLKHGLRLIYKNIPDLQSVQAKFITAVPEDYSKLYRFLQLFEEEIQRYPESFFKKNRISTIALVKKHFFDKRPIEGLYDTGYNRIFLDFSRNYDNPVLQRHNIHHEIYHMIGYQVDHALDHRDPSWEMLNVKGFAYGDIHKKKVLLNQYNYLASGMPGFVTEYAMTSPEEDKAEIFACLMIRAQHKLVNKWVAKDKILKNKISVLKDFIQRFCPDMNEEFWKNILEN